MFVHLTRCPNPFCFLHTREQQGGWNLGLEHILYHIRYTRWRCHLPFYVTTISVFEGGGLMVAQPSKPACNRYLPDTPHLSGRCRTRHTSLAFQDSHTRPPPTLTNHKPAALLSSHLHILLRRTDLQCHLPQRCCYFKSDTRTAETDVHQYMLHGIIFHMENLHAMSQQ